MKRFALLLAALPIFLSAAAQNDPMARPEAVVVSGNARFTILTDRLVRMEWAENSAFEDRASLTIVNRNLPVPRFSSSLKDGILSRDGWALVDESGRHLFTDDGCQAVFRTHRVTFEGLAAVGKIVDVEWVPVNLFGFIPQCCNQGRISLTCHNKQFYQIFHNFAK